MVEKKISIFCSPNKDIYESYYNHIVEILHSKNWKIAASVGCSRKIANEIISEKIQKSDFMITLGGDGTILMASRLSSKTPILGINFGKIGFLTEIFPTQIDEALNNIENEKYWIESVFRLGGFIISNTGIKTKLPTALNEFLIMTKRFAKMISVEIYIDGEPITKTRGDGFIISTPTGSTAYSLSAGGPVLLSGSNSYLLVPISPLWGKMRPIVLPKGHKLKILIRPDGWDAVLIIDGIDQYELPRGSSLECDLSEEKTRFIRFGCRYSRLSKLMLLI